MGNAELITSRTSALRIDTAALALMWLLALVTYFRLPDRFPIHFDLAGRPDGWAERGAEGFLTWLLLPIMASLTSLLMRWAARATRTNPTLWNIPRKREFLALDAARREPIQLLLEASMAWLTLLVTLLLLLLQAATLVAAHGRSFGGLVLPFVLVGFSMTVLIYAARTSGRAQSAIERAHREPKP